MADADRTTIKIPILMAESIDRFLKTNVAKKNAMFSRADVVVALLRRFLADYEKEYGLFVSREAIRTSNGNDAMKPFD